VQSHPEACLKNSILLLLFFFFWCCFLDIREVNEAVNELSLEEEDYVALKQFIYVALKQFIIGYPEFDQITLAHKLERHELLPFRRLGSWLSGYL
jgi:hypothetical protein